MRAILAVPRQVLTMKTNKLIFQQSIAAFLFSGAAAVLFLLLMSLYSSFILLIPAAIYSLIIGYMAMQVTRLQKQGHYYSYQECLNRIKGQDDKARTQGKKKHNWGLMLFLFAWPLIVIIFILKGMLLSKTDNSYDQFYIYNAVIINPGCRRGFIAMGVGFILLSIAILLGIESSAVFLFISLVLIYGDIELVGGLLNML